MASYYYWQNNGGICPPWMPPPPANSGNSEGQSQQHDLQLKVLNSVNKKDFKVYTLRGIQCELILSPEKLKEIILNQCGSDVVPSVDKMEIGYYSQSKKIWINNRLDLSDAWSIVAKGERLTLWCVGVGEISRKCDNRATSDDENDTFVKKQKMSKVEEKRVIVEDYERQLKEKHDGKYTRFQLKLWAEMLAVGSHEDLDTPPSASMFAPPSSVASKSKSNRSDSSVNDSIITGMMAVVNSLCQSVTKQQTEQKTVLSPVKRAELRSTYMRQLTDLRKLFDDGIINRDEYEEQRCEIVQSMRGLHA